MEEKLYTVALILSVYATDEENAIVEFTERIMQHDYDRDSLDVELEEEDG